MTPPSVLVIDDDLSFGELTRRRLERMNLNVDFYPRGEGAMARIVEGQFDLVIVDVNMPGMSGLQLVDMLRTSNRQTQVLLYSSLETSELRAAAERHGVSAYLPKSASGKDLEAFVRELIGARAISSTFRAVEDPDD